MPPANTRGFSLFEVLVAVAVLAGCAVILAQIASFSRQGIEKLQYRTQAQIFCQSKLAEILSGAEPLEAVSKRELPDQPGWFYSVQVERRESDGLVAVSVRTWLERGDTTTGTEGSGTVLAESTLVRWVRDPQRPAVTRQDRQVLDEGGGMVRSSAPSQGRISGGRSRQGGFSRRFGTGLYGERRFRGSPSEE
ncbi:MAG: prepilin-type N-terminal cleavage/methylation domain-containing protein [Thermoguttaceae bacterium]|nr:prepilin-type N-terminal cleavage/methylation domain-containing protein [Thermoguttaceae bacterium]MDW8079670.1 prepilin-type N-terminal cleavage/methylation domain-containing protein [Thermoguttaceae bacterium]